MAPEQHQPEIGHSFESDTWALGVIMFHLLTGKSPFAKTVSNIKEPESKIESAEY